MKRLFLLALATATLAGCFGNLKPGAVCAKHSECQHGYSCLVFGNFPEPDAGCVPREKICSKPCYSDPDCKPLGEGFMCFQSCDNRTLCAQGR